MKTVLVFCKSYFGRSGGIYNVQTYVQVILDLGFKVIVIAKQDSLPDANTLCQIENLEIQTIGSNFFDRHPLKWLRPKSRVRMSQATQAVIKLVKTAKPSLIMVHGERPHLIYLRLQNYAPVAFFRHDAILACPANQRFLPQSRQVCTQPVGLRCLATDKQEHCLSELSLMHKLGRIGLRRLDLYMLKKFSYFGANSHYVSKIHGTKAIILYPPMRFFPEPPLNTHFKNPFQLVFVGRLASIKGVKDALKILQHLPSQYHLSIIGDGPLRPALEQYCKTYQLEGQVTFTGWLSFEEVIEQMQQGGLTLVPSLWDEAFGLVGVESFACGTPVVAYAVGGIPEWCRPPYGITVPCGAFEQAAAAVLKLTEDRSTWQDLCHQCVAYARENFSKQKFEAQLKQFLEMAIASRD